MCIWSNTVRSCEITSVHPSINAVEINSYYLTEGIILRVKNFVSTRNNSLEIYTRQILPSINDQIRIFIRSTGLCQLQQYDPARKPQISTKTWPPDLRPLLNVSLKIHKLQRDSSTQINNWRAWKRNPAPEKIHPSHGETQIPLRV